MAAHRTFGAAVLASCRHSGRRRRPTESSCCRWARFTTGPLGMSNADRGARGHFYPRGPAALGVSSTRCGVSRLTVVAKRPVLGRAATGHFGLTGLKRQRCSRRAASAAQYVRITSAPARRIEVRVSSIGGVAVDPAVGGGGLDHGVLAGDVVGRDRARRRRRGRGARRRGRAAPASPSRCRRPRPRRAAPRARPRGRWRGPAGRCGGRPRARSSTASRKGPKKAEAYFAE